MDLKQIVLKWALSNAVEHGGKASVNAVMSKVLGENPGLKTQVAEVKKIVEKVVEEVNNLSLDEQSSMLYKIAPEKLAKPKTVEAERLLPPLPSAVDGRVITRLPPEPSGYMHIGHAIAGLINEYYARKYNGKLWLRFEDTNPRKVQLIYYESFRKGYKWLGIEWDFEKNNSDDMEIYYDYGLKMIKKGVLYPCFCSTDEMRLQRYKLIGCVHREGDVQQNIDIWEKVLNGMYKEGEVSFRLKGCLDSQNSALRDPVLFRIVDHPHPLKGRDYRLWPTYDFAAAVQDALCKITHVLRSSEFAFRDELQNLIRHHLSLPNPVYVEFARFEFKGVPTSKRLIREMIEKKIVSGWDDPRLSTIEAIRRRGLQPKTLREFTYTYAGISFAKKEYDWSLIYSINRKLIDPHCRRFFFVHKPVKLMLKNFPSRKVEIPYHPSSNLGKRTVEVGDTVYISGSDIAGLKVGDVFRCKLLANVRVEEITSEAVVGEVFGDGPIEGIKIVQWVPEDHVDVKVFMYAELVGEDGSINPQSVREITGYGERDVESVNVGEVVQFERFGFCRRDSPHELVFIYCHE